MTTDETAKRYAKNEYCVKCGKQADVFFGLADPDATLYPYCQNCLLKAKMSIYERIEKWQK